MDERSEGVTTEEQTSRPALHSMLMLGSLLAFGLAWWWTRSETIEARVELEAGGVQVQVAGTDRQLLYALLYPAGDESLKFASAGAELAYSESRRSSLKAIADESGWRRFELRDGTASGKSARVHYRLQRRPFDNEPQEVESRTAYIGENLGLLPHSAVFPQAIASGVELELRIGSLESSRQSLPAFDAEQEWISWLPREAEARSIGDTALYVLPGIDTDTVQAVTDLCHRFDESMHTDRARPIVILERGRPEDAGSHLVIGGRVVLLRLDRASPLRLAAAGGALWRAYWSEFETDALQDLGALMRRYGAEFLGASLVTGGETDTNALRAERAVERMLVTLADASVRPIPMRPHRKALWDRLVPGLTAWLAASFAHQDESLARALAAQAVPDPTTLPGFARAMQVDPALKAFLTRGKIPAVEVELPDAHPLRWFAHKPTPAVWRADELAGYELAVGVSQSGYLETCGCKVAQVGGLARRATVLRDIRERDGLILEAGQFLSGVPLDAGDAMARATQRTFLEGFAHLPHHAVALGWAEVVSGLPQLIEDLAHYPDLPVVCTNLFTADGQRVFPGHRIVEHRDERVAIVGWLSADATGSVLTTFEAGLGPYRVVEDPQLLELEIECAARAADRVFVLGTIAHRFLRKHAKLWKSVDAVLTGDTWDVHAGSFEHTRGPRKRSRSQAYRLGQAWVLSAAYGPGGFSLFEDCRFPAGPRSAQPVWLTELVDKAGDVDAIVAGLADMSAAAFAEIEHPLPRDQEYVGVQRCASCHHDYVEDWKNTAHSQAIDTLIHVRRDRHPKCVQCHVTGYASERGFVEPKRREALVNVQCEVCHGPGGRHARTARKEDIRLSPGLETCFRCHDAEHSDQFAGREVEAMRSIAHPSLKRSF